MSDNSLVESIDTETLLEDVDIEDALQQVELGELLRQLPLETVLSGFGAAAGGEVGAILGRKIDTVLDTAGSEPADDASSDENESTTDTDDAGEDSDDAEADEEDADENSDDTEGDETDTEEDSDDADTDETDGEVPETREELEALSYRELQSLAAETDVKGNISQERMTEELAEEFGLENE